MAGILRSILRFPNQANICSKAKHFLKRFIDLLRLVSVVWLEKNHSESEEEDDIDVHQPLVKYILMRSPKSCRRMTATLKARRGWCPTKLVSNPRATTSNYRHPLNSSNVS